MLVLSRKLGESVVMPTSDGEIVVTVVENRGDHFRLGFDAPRDIPIHRKEIWEKLEGGERVEPETEAEYGIGLSVWCRRYGQAVVGRIVDIKRSSTGMVIYVIQNAGTNSTMNQPALREFQKGRAPLKELNA
jgi:carbon storage regulator